MFKLTIPTPCHENWDGMEPDEQGRYCNACSKTVIDFTAMSNDELRNFFFLRKEEQVCGKLSATQLRQTRIELPQHIFRLEMPWWKRFLVASLLAFGATLFSCNTSISHINNVEGTAVKDKGEVEANPIGLLLPAVGDTIIPLPACSDKGGVIAQESPVDEIIMVGKIMPEIYIDSIPVDVLPETLKADTIARPVIIEPTPLPIETPPKADSVRVDSIPVTYS